MRLLGVLCLILLGGCGVKPGYETYGLRTYQIEIEPEFLGEMWGGATQHVDVPAVVRVDGRKMRAEVSLAGSSTLMEPKKNFTVKLNDADVDGISEIRLAANTKDPPMLRALLARDVFTSIGVPSPVVEPVFVYLNERIMGLYISTEIIDAPFFARRNFDVTQWFEAKGSSNFDETFEGRIADAFKAKPTDNLEPILGLKRTLLIAEDPEFEAKIFQILDRQSIVRYLSAAKILNNWDGFSKNLHLFHRRDTRLIELAAWDFDLIWQTDFHPNPIPWATNALFNRVGKLSSVRSAVDAKVQDLLANEGSLANIRAKMDIWSERIRPAYEADPYLGQSRYDFDVEAQKFDAMIEAWYLKILQAKAQ